MADYYSVAFMTSRDGVFAIFQGAAETGPHRLKDGNTEKMWDNSGRKKPYKTLKIRAGKMAVTVEILLR